MTDPSVVVNSEFVLKGCVWAREIAETCRIIAGGETAEQYSEQKAVLLIE